METGTVKVSSHQTQGYDHRPLHAACAACCSILTKTDIYMIYTRDQHVNKTTSNPTCEFGRHSDGFDIIDPAARNRLATQLRGFGHDRLAALQGWLLSRVSREQRARAIICSPSCCVILLGRLRCGAASRTNPVVGCGTGPSLEVKKYKEYYWHTGHWVCTRVQ